MLSLSPKGPRAPWASIAIAIGIISIILWVWQSLRSCVLQDSKNRHYGPSNLKMKSQTSTKEKFNTSNKDNKLWMNSGGLPYKIANAPKFDTEWILKDPTVKFFDVYSKPIRTLYSQVHWTSHGNIPLPDEVVQRYSGSDKNTSDTIAIVGYEADQVRIDPQTNQEVPVPITWAYDHHYMAFVLGQKENGEKTSMIEVPMQTAMEESSSKAHLGHMAAAGASRLWIPGTLSQESNSSPSLGQQGGASDYSHSFFSEGNGGESRKSYHSYPRGYAQLVRKPHSFSITPMQIDVWNRETMNSSEFVPPPLDRVHDYFPGTSHISARLLENLAEAKYNPLLECPCTDRLPKTWAMTYKLLPIQRETPHEDCLEDADECFDAAIRLGLSGTAIHHRVVPEYDRKVGSCEAVLRSDGSVEVLWRTKFGWTALPANSYLRQEGDEEYAHEVENAEQCFEFQNQQSWKSYPPGTTIHVPQYNSKVGSCDAVLQSDGRIEVVWRPHFNTRFIDNNAPMEETVVGSTAAGSLINATLVANTTNETVEIILRGPYLEEQTSEPWFAIGFGARSMCKMMTADECIPGGPYAIVVLPPSKDNPSLVVERKLDYHGPGRILSASNYDLNVVSNKIETETHCVISDDNSERDFVELKRRVVRLVRPLQGPSDDYYSFPLQVSDLETNPLDIILAKGCLGTTQFGQHCGHQSPNPIFFSRVDQWQSIHRDGIKGKLNGNLFSNQCSDQPLGDLAKQANPTCTLETYQGGLACCSHGNFLLDANQTIPWKDQVLDYRFKFRFYYQDYIEGTKNKAKIATVAEPSSTKIQKKDSHRDLPRFYWQTEMRAGEYDIPECKTPEDPPSCVHVITSRWKVHEFSEFGYFPKEDEGVGIELIYAGPHCHAPACLSMELYNDDTGELLCSVEPLRGKGRNKHTENNDSNSNHNNHNKEDYDEAGFLAIPPCMWSHNADDGLPETVFLSHNTTLLSIKKANSTFLHTGDMASWQMRGVFAHSSNNNNIEEEKLLSPEDETLEVESDLFSAKRAHGRLRKP